MYEINIGLQYMLCGNHNMLSRSTLLECFSSYRMSKQLKSIYRFFLSFSLKVLSFMNSELEKPKKISASKYAFLSKKVKRPGNGTCDVAAVMPPSLSVFYLGKMWQTKYLKLNFSVFCCVLNRNQRNCWVKSVNIQPEAEQVPSSTSLLQDLIMEWMLGQKR